VSAAKSASTINLHLQTTQILVLYAQTVLLWTPLVNPPAAAAAAAIEVSACIIGLGQMQG
jgi:hypothetical protein